MVDGVSTQQQSQQQQQVWLITGVSRGLGKALCDIVLNKGHIVIGTTRNGKCEQQTATAGEFHCLPFDAAELDKAAEVVQQAYDIKGRLDFVVSNAGYAQLGAIEEISLQQIKRQYDVNVFAVYLVMQKAVELLKKQQSKSMIINVTSIAGIKASPGSAVYASSKHAVEALSEGLAQEIAAYKQVRVMCVEPGAFRTDFLDETSRSFGEKKMEEYEPLRTTYYKRHRNQQNDPVKGMQVVYDVATDSEKSPPLRLVLGKDALQRGLEKAQSLMDNFKAYEKQSSSTDVTPA